jgi:uncharacterized membrane protein
LHQHDLSQKEQKHRTEVIKKKMDAAASEENALAACKNPIHWISMIINQFSSLLS